MQDSRACSQLRCPTAHCPRPTCRQVLGDFEEGHVVVRLPHRGGQQAAGLEHARKLLDGQLKVGHEPAEECRGAWEDVWSGGGGPCLRCARAAPDFPSLYQAAPEPRLPAQPATSRQTTEPEPSHEAQGAGDCVKAGVRVAVQVLGVRRLKAHVGQARTCRPRLAQLQKRVGQVGGHQLRLGQRCRQRQRRFAAAEGTGGRRQKRWVSSSKQLAAVSLGSLPASPGSTWRRCQN